MTYEEAENKLDETFIGDLELKITLTNALKKQIEKPPKWLGEKSISLFALGCPNCGEFVCFRQKYCAYCGQKIEQGEVV